MLPSIPLAQAISRIGPSSSCFEIMENTPPHGTDGALLCIWDNGEACRAIRNSDEFMPLAKRMSMADALNIYGKSDCMA